MGSGFSDMIGIEAAGEELAKALKEAEANATMELRNVTLTGLNYIKSFTPVISLIMVFLILLLLVGILSILSRMLDDLEVSEYVRNRILAVVSIVLYIWFVVVQIAAAVKQKGPIAIVIAVMASIGLMVISILFIWLSCRTPSEDESKSNSNVPMNNIHSQNQHLSINDTLPKSTGKRQRDAAQN
jgi:uncharacterized membrane protein YhaH (DUF805 family)